MESRVRARLRVSFESTLVWAFGGSWAFNVSDMSERSLSVRMALMCWISCMMDMMVIGMSSLDVLDVLHVGHNDSRLNRRDFAVDSLSLGAF